ncbi:MAG: glycosyltransferase family 4 protein [Bacteroidales bacterium]|jgi:glycosyltransferase involved in cell wall biosynthesis
MNILFLCNKNPYPEMDGGCISINNGIKEAIRRNYNIKVLAVNSYKNHVNPKDLPKDYLEKTKFENVFLDLKIKPLRFLSTYFTGKSPHMIRFFSKEFNNKLLDILSNNNFDVVILESLFMCPYIETIRGFSKKLKIVLRAHNVEYKIWERMAKSENNGNIKDKIKKVALKHVYKTLKKYELDAIKKVDGIAAITEVDKKFFEQHTDVPVTVVPFGYDISNFYVKEDDKNFIPNTIFHLGAMNWHPNLEGVNWFLYNVWSKLLAQKPELKLYLAGRKMSEEWMNKKIDNVVMVGEVDNVKDFMLSNQIMIVPLLSGSGMRIKIIEGLALGKVIVSTTIGAEGIDVNNKKDILIADTPEDFVSAILEVLENKELFNSISNAAITTAQKYDIKKIYDNYMSFISTLNPMG